MKKTMRLAVISALAVVLSVALVSLLQPATLLMFDTKHHVL